MKEFLENYKKDTITLVNENEDSNSDAIEKDEKNEKKVFKNKFTVNIKNKINNKENNINKKSIRDSVRLLTYNFFCRPPPVNTNKDDYKDSRLQDFIEQLHNFDIICFQELFTTLNDRKHRMIREAAKVGLKYYLSSKVPSLFSHYLVDSGLLILSRYQIIEHDYYQYFINILGDAVGSKGVLYAKIKINNKYLFLFNTHLQSTYFNESQRNIDFTIQIRTSQTEELINFVYNKLLVIPREEVKNGLILIAGDFNIDAHDNKFIKKKIKFPKYKNTEYNIFKKKINKLGTAIDLMEKKYNKHIYTFGNNEKEEYDHTFISKVEFNIKQTLDYIWEINPDYNLKIYKSEYQTLKNKNNYEDEKNNEKNKIKVLYDTLTVQEFLVKNRPYQQLSDHFGISVEIYVPKLYDKGSNSFDASNIEFPLKNI